MFKRLRARFRADRVVDHAELKDERLQHGKDLPAPNARTDAWYSGPVRDSQFVDEGRPRK